MPLIRHAHSSDAEQIAAIYAPYCETPISFELTAPSAAEIAARLQSHVETHPWLVIEEDGCLLGYAYASPHHERAAYRWSVNVSVYVSRNAHRRGIGRKLYERLFEILRAQGFINAYAGITMPNESSEKLHAALGFQLVGVYKAVGFKSDRWHDVAWYHLQLQPAPAAPHETERVSAVTSTV